MLGAQNKRLQQPAAAVQESSKEKKPSTATATVEEEDESTIDVTKVSTSAFDQHRRYLGARRPTVVGSHSRGIEVGYDA